MNTLARPLYLSLVVSGVLAVGLLSGNRSFAAERPGPVPFDWAAQIDRARPSVGRVVQLFETGSKSAKDLTSEGLDSLLADADVLLLGERHDHPDHHRLQAWVIARLADLGRSPVVAWEMLPQDRNGALESYSGSAADLGEHLKWKEVWGDTWPLYQPIADVALAVGAPMVGADLDRAQKKAVGKEGLAALGSNEAERLGLSAPFLTGAQERLEKTIAASHCDMLPEVMLPIMSNVQKARDAAMADAIIKAEADYDRPVVLIAGNGHVALDYAVGWYLNQRAPQLSVLALSFVEIAPEVVPSESDQTAAQKELSTVGRFLPAVQWTTPAWDREDPCVAFADSLKKMKKSPTQ